LPSQAPERSGSGARRPSGPAGADTVLMWLRPYDLRLDDNEALIKANSSAVALLPVYICNPRDFEKVNHCPHAWWLSSRAQGPTCTAAGGCLCSAGSCQGEPLPRALWHFVNFSPCLASVFPCLTACAEARGPCAATPRAYPAKPPSSVRAAGRRRLPADRSRQGRLPAGGRGRRARAAARRGLRAVPAQGPAGGGVAPAAQSLK